VELKRSLRASEEALQGLIEASLQGVLIVTKEYEPLLANQTCARIFDFESPAEIKALDSIVDLIASPALAQLGAVATDITERKRAESRRTISLCQDGGKRAR
jgi:PAS domain-containing protein